MLSLCRHQRTQTIAPASRACVGYWVRLWKNLWITNVVFFTLIRHNGYMEVNMEYVTDDTICKCGWTYAQWYDRAGEMLCLEDENGDFPPHEWEE